MFHRFLFSVGLLFAAVFVGYADVVINELNYDPINIEDEGGSVREFLEIYNPGSTTVDLSGYTFVDGIAYTFPDGVTLGANRYLVLARVPSHEFWRNKRYPVLGPYDGKLSNGGEKIELQRPDGTVVDRFSYNDDFPWPRGADGYGKTLERIAWDLPASDYHSWRTSAALHGTPGARNSVHGTLPRPMIVAQEYAPLNPTSSDEVTVTVGLDAVSLIDQVYLRWETDGSSVSDPLLPLESNWKMWKGQTAPSAEFEAWKEFDFDDSAWTTAMGGFAYGDTDQANTELLDMAGNYSTVYLRQEFDVEEPSGLGSLTLQMYFDDGFICYVNGQEVASTNAPSPYTHESLSTGSHEADEAETYSLGLAENLLFPGKNVIAVVGFNVNRNTSSDFVLAPILLSSKNDSQNRAVMNMVAISVNSASFEAVIPAHSNQSLLRYNFDVLLKDGNHVRLPHNHEPRPFESYFVYDNDISSTLPLLWVFDSLVTTLPDTSRPISGVVIKPLGAEHVQVFDGAIISSARNGQKIKFLKGEEFQGNRKLNLSLEAPREGTTAGGQSPHVEHISYELFSNFGVLAPKCDWYRVIEKGQHQQRITIQQPNENFMEMNGRDPDGNIYKIAYNEPGGYSKKTNLDEGDDDYRELFQYVNRNNRTNLSESLRKYLVIEEVMGYEVATFLLSHWDGIKNNIFLYHDPAEGGKWEIIPWDVDKTFGYTDSDPMYWRMPIDFPLTGIAPGSSELTNRSLIGPIMRPFHMDDELNREFIKRVGDSLDGLFSLERVGGMIDDAEAMLLEDLDLLEAYTSRTYPSRRSQIRTSSDTMRFFLTNRHQFLRSQLPAKFEFERTLPRKEYHAGAVIEAIQLTLSPTDGETISASVVEVIPDSFTASNLSVSSGTVEMIDHQIVWIVTEINEPAYLWYDLHAPEEDVPMMMTLSGHVTFNGTEYATMNSELKYMPENSRLLSDDWSVGSGGEWLIIDGVLNCISQDSQDPKHVWVNEDFGTGDYTVRADVRMLNWQDADLARAGIAVRVNPMDGEKALNLLYHDDTGSVDMLNDLVAWGPNGDYLWNVGEWHTMTLIAEGDTLTGRIQKTGSDAPPYEIIWSDFALLLRSPGFPGLTGSSMEGLTAQYDNFSVVVDGEVVFSDDFEDNTSVADWTLFE